MENLKEKNEILSWALFLACMFVGMGVGSIFDQTGAGMLIGMAAGYIAEALVERTRKNNRQPHQG